VPIAPRIPGRKSWLSLLALLLLAAAPGLARAAEKEPAASEAPSPAPALPAPASPAPAAPAPTTPEAAAPAPAAPEAAAPEAAPVGQEPLPKDSALLLLGSDVKNSSDTVVGQVVNVLVDGEGKPLAVVLDYGGFLGVGKRRIAVAWPMFRFSPKGAVLSLTRDQLKAFPEYRKGEDSVMATAVEAH